MRRARWSSTLGVVAGPIPIDHHRRFVADHPGVMTLGQRGDISRSCDELGAVIHADGESSRHVVLEMRSLTARRLGQRLDVVRPAPPGTEYQAAHLGASYFQDLGSAVRKIADLFGLRERLVLGILLVIVHV